MSCLRKHHETTAMDRRVSVTRVLDRDHGIFFAPDDQDRNLCGEVKPVERTGALAADIDNRSHRADEGLPRVGVEEGAVAPPDLAQIRPGTKAGSAEDL